MVSKKVLRKIGVFAMAVMVTASPVLAVSANGGIRLASATQAEVTGEEPATGEEPTPSPSTEPTTEPTTSPSTEPTTSPSTEPTTSPSTAPTTSPSTEPTTSPSTEPTTSPSTAPTTSPTTAPTSPASKGSAVSTMNLQNNAVFTDAGLKLVSTVNGYFSATCVDAAIVSTPAEDVIKAFGAAPGASVTVNVRNSTHGPAAGASIEHGLARLAGDKVAAVAGPKIDILAYLNGREVTDIESPVTIIAAVPESFRQAGYEYAVIRVQTGGRVSILPDKEADPSIVAVDTDGFGVFVLVKAPAGSFDKYR